MDRPDVFPASFYKWLTEKPLKEGEDWDIQTDEFDDSWFTAWEEYKAYLDGLFLILTDLKKKGQENSPEFKKAFKEFSELEPEVAKQFAA